MKSLQQPDVIQQPLLNDESFLRNLVSTVCQQLLESEISAALQAYPYERTVLGVSLSGKREILEVSIANPSLTVSKNESKLPLTQSQ